MEDEWNWNMNGRYRVFSIDKAIWVDVEFTDNGALVSSNTKKITLAPHEPLDTYLRRANDKMNSMKHDLDVLRLTVDALCLRMDIAAATEEKC